MCLFHDPFVLFAAFYHSCIHGGYLGSATANGPCTRVNAAMSMQKERQAIRLQQERLM